MSSKALWNERYSAGSLRSKEPAEFVAGCIQWIPVCGLALDIASGEGRNSVFLAGQGLDVIALDISEVALRHTRELTLEPRNKIHPAVVDLDDFLLPAEKFDVIVNINFLNRKVCSEVVGALKPGGLLIFETLTTGHLRWKPDFNPDFLLKPGELRTMFPELGQLRYRECDIIGRNSARSVASLAALKEVANVVEV